MKNKIIALFLAALTLVAPFALSACTGDTAESVIVQTNAFFAPFEYYSADNEIVGVDPEIMAKVGEKLGKKIEFVNVEFDVIIDNVAEGKICDVGAAGITITDARKEKVDFSIPYYTSVQYVIYPAGALTADGTADADGNYVLWDQLAGKRIGVQRNTTGDIYVSDEIACSEANGDSFTGVLYDSGASVAQFDNAQIAVDAIGANQIDVVVIDKLPASYIVEKNSGYECAALYYAGGEGEEDAATSEQYAIAVNKGKPELLEAINAVLTEMTAVDEATGKNQIDALVEKHFGIEG